MSVPLDAVARAYECLGAKRYAQAEEICRTLLANSPANAAAVHLLGLIRKDTGDPVLGEQLLRESIALEPQRAEFRANLGNLQRRQGQLEAAVASYRGALGIDRSLRAARLGLARTLKDLDQQASAQAECRILLAADGHDAETWCTLAGSLRQQYRYAEAESAYRSALAIRPGYSVAHHNLGALLTQMDRVEEALAAIEQAQRLGEITRESAINRGHALLKLNRLPQAEMAYLEAVRLSPWDADAQESLASLRFMCGDPNFIRDFAAAAAAFPEATALQFTFAEVLRRCGELHAAERLLRDLLLRGAAHVGLHRALAALLHEQGCLEAAEHEALRAVAQSPDNSAAIETLLAIQLSLGQADRAMRSINQQRVRQPLEQQWIAYWLTAARVLGDPLYKEICDYQTLVQCYEIDAPGNRWQSMAALNTAASDALLQCHQFSRHPLGQSLRHGSQTSRSLLSHPDAALQSIIQAFKEPLADYSQMLQRAGANPLLMPSRGAAVIEKCWSVLLGPGGFHVSHIHPQGWISSAYYVCVPDEADDTTMMAGWLKFGEPPFAVPGCGAERFVQPRPGRLVLFPSFLWHGTNPILGTTPRLTIAFDAVAR